jgi:hypothetical protein
MCILVFKKVAITESELCMFGLNVVQGLLDDDGFISYSLLEASLLGIGNWTYWEYMLTNEERVEVAIRAVFEHKDMGTLSSVIAEVRRYILWVVVATAPCTFGMATEKRGMGESSWQNTMLHYFMRLLAFTPVLWNWETSRESGRRAGVAVLERSRVQLEEEGNGLDAALVAEGIAFVATFLHQLEMSHGHYLDKDSILYARNIVWSTDTFTYSELLPNYSFGPALANQVIDNQEVFF